MRTTSRNKKTTAFVNAAAVLVALELGSLGVLEQRTAHAACYTPAEQTVGWKRVSLPADAPTLAADLDISQLRAGEPVWLTEPWRFDGVGITRYHPGRTEYSFAVTPASRGSFELSFAQELAGAKVDVWANTNTGTLWLWHENRVAYNDISVRWNGPQVHWVVVRVHHHLRREPLVQRFRASREAQFTKESWLPSEFRTPRSLYYYQPAGRSLTLCDAPGRELSVEQQLLTQAGAPMPTAVKRAP